MQINSAFGIKKPIKICYTNFNSSDINIINLIINPDPNVIDFEELDMVVVYGGWIDKTYLNKLMKKIDKNKLCFCPGETNSQFKSENLIPERIELVAVYQFIKVNCKSNIVTDDMFLLAKRIARSYKIEM